MHVVTWHFKSKKFKKNSETHETLLDVMSGHQDDVVKNLACLTKVWTHTPLTLRSNSLDARGSEREQCMFDDEREVASSYDLQFFPRLTCTTTTVM